jgi:outer membrane protein assembly factor BamB
MTTTRRRFAAALPALALGTPLLAPAARAGQATPVASPVASSATGVPMFHVNPAHTGENPGPGPIANPEILWRFETGGMQSSPAVVNGSVYAGSLDGFLYAVDAATGAERWQFEVGGYVGSPTVTAEGIVIASGGGGVLYALSSSDGSEIWSATSAAPSLFSDGTLAEEVDEIGGMIVDELLYIGGYAGSVYAINPRTSSLYWEFQTGNRNWISPAVASKTVFARSDDGNLYAIDAATGEEVWTATIGWNNESSSPAVADDTVFVGGSDGAIVALDATTGAETWRVPAEGIVDSSAAVSGGIVYIGSGVAQGPGTIHALDAATGAERWTATLAGGLGSSVSLASGAAYAGDRDGQLHCFDAATGETLWTVQTDDGFVVSTPAILDGVIYVGAVGSETHHLYAIGGDTA